jgi:hypothetical protein
MLEIMTRLGYHTGFTLTQVANREKYSQCEIDFWGDKGRQTVKVYHRQQRRGGEGVPYILKHPKFSLDLMSRLEIYNWSVDHVYIFVRALEEAVKSGKALKAYRPQRKWRYHVINHTGRAVLMVNEYDLPHTYVKYPLYVQDFSYFMKTMDFLVRDFPTSSVYSAWVESIDIWKVKDYE